jgi:hypothetical protein
MLLYIKDPVKKVEVLVVKDVVGAAMRKIVRQTRQVRGSAVHTDRPRSDGKGFFS